MGDCWPATVSMLPTVPWYVVWRRVGSSSLLVTFEDNAIPFGNRYFYATCSDDVRSSVVVFLQFYSNNSMSHTSVTLLRLSPLFFRSLHATVGILSLLYLLHTFQESVAFRCMTELSVFEVIAREIPPLNTRQTGLNTKKKYKIMRQIPLKASPPASDVSRFS